MSSASSRLSLEAALHPKTRVARTRTVVRRDVILYSRRLHRVSVRLIAWCLLVTLPLYGISSTVIDLLGRNHVHRGLPVSATVVNAVEAPSIVEGLVDFRRMVPISDSGDRHGHGHDESRRHHHDAFDPTVVTYDAPAEGSTAGGGSASAGSVSPMLALAWTLRVLPPPASTLAWRTPAPVSFASVDPIPLERPPRTA